MSGPQTAGEPEGEPVANTSQYDGCLRAGWETPAGAGVVGLATDHSPHEKRRPIGRPFQAATAADVGDEMARGRRRVV